MSAGSRRAVSRGGSEKAWELLARYLEQLEEGGETELYMSPESVRLLKRQLAAQMQPVNGRPLHAPRASAASAPAAAPKEAGAAAPKARAVAAGAPKPAPSFAEPEVVVVEPVFGVTRSAPDMFAAPSPLESCGTLADLEKLTSLCTKCELAATRTKVVFGVGNAKARLMFIGEAPGHDEDMQGIPFVGRAGQLLDKILEAAGIPRDDVYIGNILKCRPPNNRTPMANEIDACSPYLAKQLEIIKPAVVCTLGLPATTTLLGVKGSMGSLRGKIYQYGDIKVIPTYHPAAALRDPNYKRPLLEDFLIVKREYERG